MKIKKDQVFKKLKLYMEANGISRYESDIAKLLKNETKDANLNYSYDGLGSLIMTKKGHTQGPRIMISAHMDEVGYLVSNILDNGQISVTAVGGIWPNIIIGTKAKLITSDNKEFIGIFGHTSIHIMESEKLQKALTNKELFVDFGFDNKTIAQEAGVSIGDRIYIHGQTLQLFNPNLVAGKAMDNRAGITVMDLVINSLANQKLPNKTYFVATTQEEVGARGAKSAVSIIKPDIAIAIDTTSSYDTFLSGEGENKLSKGVALRVFDSSTMMDPRLIKFMFELAKENQIPVYKFVAQGGGTDASKLQYGKGGVATITLSIPQRYLHSPIGVCDINDLIANIQLLIHFLKAMDSDTWEAMKYK